LEGRSLVEIGLTNFNAALPSAEPNNNDVEVALSFRCLVEKRNTSGIVKEGCTLQTSILARKSDLDMLWCVPA
jgi:hypothetical protein